MEVYIIYSSKSHISDKAYHTLEEAYDAIKKILKDNDILGSEEE